MKTETTAMTQPASCPTDTVAFRRRSPVDYSGLLILVVVGVLCGIILQRKNLMDSPNDSSRWNTVYYLLQHGTYQYLPVRDVPWAVRGTKDDSDLPLWDTPVLWTIDMIMVDGKLYSSKPPLLPTVLAGVGWCVQKVTGQTFQENPWFIQRALLILMQVIPFAIMLLILRRHLVRLAERAGGAAEEEELEKKAGKMPVPQVAHFAMAVACFGTLLTPWIITLNNHVIAAATGLIALDAAIRIWFEARREWYWFTLAGFFAAFTASIELPAGLLAVVLFVALLAKDYKRTLIAGLLPAIIPTAAALYTNHIVTHQLMPAYESWNKPGGFYDFPGSYWNNRSGIDAINEPKYVYLAHMLIGHDGFFSLTPIFLVSLAGLVREWTGRRKHLAWMVVGITATVIVVYTFKTNNYGGGCHGFRWLFWVVPMWLLFLPAGIAWFARTFAGRYLLYGLFFVSLFTVGFALANPWSTNWMRLLLRTAGVIAY